MSMQSQRARFLPWAATGLVTALCGILALLQYRWIGEISDSERQSLQVSLRANLNELRQELNEQIATAARSLRPASLDGAGTDRQTAYSAQYLRWKQTHEPLFRRIALAVPDGEQLSFSQLDLATGRFTVGSWPEEWSGMRLRLTQRLHREAVGPFNEVGEPVLLEMPRFGFAPGEPEQEWLILELDGAYLREHLLPNLLASHLGAGSKSEYEAEVVLNRDPSVIVYRSSAQPIGDQFDATVTLLDPRLPTPLRGVVVNPRGPIPGGLRKLPPVPRFPGGGIGFSTPGRPSGAPGIAEGLWLLRVRHRAGSLEALVAQARTRNLAVSLSLLFLILITVSMLVHLARRAQQLAELQINFVAGVSHELRTPLTVIRTAAYNLRGKLAHRPQQVEQYGALIQDESEKLGGLVEQILQFASAKAGHVIRRREPVVVKNLIDRSLAGTQGLCEGAKVVFEQHVAENLPLVFADEAALQRALKNLVDNAIKHGAGAVPWVGIWASAIYDEQGLGVQISVSDHGPGIPMEEQSQIFEPFFRGSRAVADQVHGTGLGLDLVKRIVEAHGGTIRVESGAERGTVFVIRLPALTPERQDALAPSLG